MYDWILENEEVGVVPLHQFRRSDEYDYDFNGCLVCQQFDHADHSDINFIKLPK